MDEGYEEALGVITRLGQKKDETAEYIDITETFAAEAPEKPEPYSALAGILSSMEAVKPKREETAAAQQSAEGRAAVQTSQMLQATGREAAAIGGILMKGAAAAATASERLGSAVAGEIAPKLKKEARATAAATAKAGSAIGEELSTTLAKEVKQIGSQLPRVAENVKRMTEKRIDISGLVLPNLPVADQVSELERIIEALNENIFNTEQVSIVRQELEGLRQVIASRPDKGIDPAIAQLRESRLQAALGMLESRVN